MSDDSVIDPIVAAVKAGHLEEAESYCRSALMHDAADPDVLLLLGIVLQHQGRTRDAVQPFARLTELCPRDSTHWTNYATALHRAGDVAEAQAAILKAIETTPDEPERLENLGLLCLELGSPQAARAALLRAVDKAPDVPRIHIHAARALIACHDLRAGDLLRPWRGWQVADDLLLELADLLTQVSEQADALEILEDLAARKPTDWAVQLLLAKVYERVNRADDAEAKLEWVDAMRGTDPDSGWIARELDMQRSQLAMRRRDYGRARALLAAIGPRYPEDYGFYFSLAQASDRLGDAPAAIDALATAHRLQVEEIRVSNPHLLEPGAPLLPNVDERVSDSDHRSWPALRAPDASQSPVFVVGFPRSGTTLLEQMLDAHPRLQSMDERPFLNMLSSQLRNVGIEVPRDLGRLTQRDCDELRKGYVLMGCGKVARRWDARLVDKNPLNMLWLPMIHRLFPEAKFILALRHPCDVIWSCYLQNFRAAPLMAACRSLDTLAHAYVAAMRNWLQHVAVFDPDVFVSRFEDLVADTSAQADRIADFLGIGEAGSMLNFAARAQEKGFIRTPSYTQVVEPINARGVGRWRQYRAYYNEALPILQPMLEHWGYDASPATALAGA